MMHPWHLDEIVKKFERDHGTPIDPLLRTMIDGFNEREGFTTYPYRDSRGNLTIGPGLLIAPDVDQKRNPIEPRTYSGFEFTRRGYPAEAGLVDRDEANFQLRQLMALPRGNAADDETLTSIGMTHEQALRYAVDKLEQVRESLRSQFPAFDTYRMGIQETLVDLAWNTGGGNFAKDWPRMTAAIKSGDWATAAHESQVSYDPDAEPGIGRRNAWRIGKFFEPETYPGYQAPPPAADGFYGQDGYPGYAPRAATGGVSAPTSSAVPDGRELTGEDLANLSDEDFDAAWPQFARAARGPSII